MFGHSLESSVHMAHTLHDFVDGVFTQALDAAAAAAALIYDL